MVSSAGVAEEQKLLGPGGDGFQQGHEAQGAFADGVVGLCGCCIHHETCWQAKRKSTYAFAYVLTFLWRPQGDLNPRRLRERQVSWARLDDRDAWGA